MADHEASLIARWSSSQRPTIEDRADEAGVMIDRLARTLEKEYGLNKDRLEEILLSSPVDKKNISKYKKINNAFW